jgi:hypothetical protein
LDGDEGMLVREKTDLLEDEVMPPGDHGKGTPPAPAVWKGVPALPLPL